MALHLCILILSTAVNYLGRDAKTPVFGGFAQVKFKPVRWASEISENIEFLVSSFEIMLSRNRITKALTRLGGWAGWSASLLFSYNEVRSFRIECPIGIAVPWFNLIINL